MDTGTKDAAHQTADSQADLLTDLGYDGIGWSPGQAPEMLAALDRRGLRMFTVYTGIEIGSGPPKLDQIGQLASQLKGRGAILWLFITSKQFQPSSDAGDADAVAALREVAAIASGAGLRVALYPHTGFWMERVQDAVRLAKKVERANVGVTFNLCHALRVGDENKIPELLDLARPHLFVVAINGADHEGDWDRLIQPLDRGAFDVLPLLRKLKAIGFTGPIGLQHYGIKGSARENLKHSINAWRKLSAQAAAVESSATASASLQFLEDKARQLIAGCRVRAGDGTTFFTPDGKGNYRALWTRDFAYMVENAGDLMPAGDVESCLRALVRGVRGDGAAPDRVRPDGVAVYVAGPENHPLGEPNIDNAQFLVIAADEYLRRLPKPRQRELFVEWAPTLDRAMNYIPRSTNGLVYNDPAKPHSPYGFTDTVGKTGELLFESLLYWTASKRLAARYVDDGGEKSARGYSIRAAMIETNLAALWDDKPGVFLAATKDCRQIDVWGNAYAIWLDFPLGAKRARALQFLRDHRERYLWHGQVRHLLAGEHWQRLLTPVEPEHYQNGAYWATASGWMMWSLAQSDRALAQQIWIDLIQDFQREDVCECVHKGYRQLPSYVVSATNPLAAARRLGF